MGEFYKPFKHTPDNSGKQEPEPHKANRRGFIFGALAGMGSMKLGKKIADVSNRQSEIKSKSKREEIVEKIFAETGIPKEALAYLFTTVNQVGGKIEYTLGNKKVIAEKIADEVTIHVFDLPPETKKPKNFEKQQPLVI